jgi:hypothetical protein
MKSYMDNGVTHRNRESERRSKLGGKWNDIVNLKSLISINVIEY